MTPSALSFFCLFFGSSLNVFAINTKYRWPTSSSQSTVPYSQKRERAAEQRNMIVKTHGGTSCTLSLARRRHKCTHAYAGNHLLTRGSALYTRAGGSVMLLSLNQRASTLGYVPVTRQQLGSPRRAPLGIGYGGRRTPGCSSRTRAHAHTPRNQRRIGA